ncbi:MAG: AlkZ-related protein [Anaerolineae bacterium]
MLTLSLEALENLRDDRYYRTPKLRLHSEKQALVFINKVGFCFLFHDQNTEIPTLLEAIAGTRREYENDHYDADIGRAWGWKDSLPVAGLVYYGKQLRFKPTLISLAMLPSFYALSPNYGELDDYLNEYQEGTLSKDAKAIYEVLLERGPQATTHLRRYANLWGGGENARRFERAITELQVGLKIVKSGISDVSRWGYAYIYDLFLHRFPDVPAAARSISRRQAMENILMQHLDNVVAASEASLVRLFRWELWEWEKLMESLRNQDIVRTLTITDTGESWLTLRATEENLANR